MARFGILLTLLLLISSSMHGQHYVDSTQTYLKNGANIHVQPGDTIYFTGGNWPYIMLENFQGKPDSLITFINSDGKVYIHNDHYFGINIKNCTHFRLSGTGDTQYKYGFHIAQVSQGGGIGLGSLSSSFEIDHIQVENTLVAGLYAKSDPDNTFASSRDSFLLEDVYIHHNYFRNIGDEALYIGSTKYFGQPINYQGSDTLVLPHLLKNVEIAWNTFYDIGWDAIQLSSASLGQNSIHDNIIIGDSKRMSFNQMSGIMVGGGTKADVYNNHIVNGKGSGIVIASLGGQRIFNNVIVHAGQGFYPDDPMQMQHGIYVGDISMQADSSLYIFHNTIVRPKSDCIRFTSTLSKNNIIANNALVDPGNYEFYDTLHTSFTKDDAYIMISDPNISIDTFKNVTHQDFHWFGFTDTLRYQFMPLAGSPLLNRASHHVKVTIDFDHFNDVRPYENINDVGAFEYNPLTVQLHPSTNANTSLQIYPNPAHDHLTVRAPFPCDSTPDVRFYSIHGEEIDIPFVFDPVSGLLRAQVHKLTTGMYIIVLKCEEEQASTKFIVSTSGTE